jgi:parallel beta-helix repeat protein
MGEEKMRKEILILIIVGILILSGFGVVVVTSVPTLSYQKEMERQKSENKEKLQFWFLKVHVKEIYGTVDDPQYRPLANVTVELTDSIYGIIWHFDWNGTTDESGETEWIMIFPSVIYKVTVSKDGFHTYKCRPFTIFAIEDQPDYVDVYFTMAEDGSPFIQPISQSNLQSNSKSSQQSSSTPSSKNVMSVITSNGTNIVKKSTMPTLDGNTLYVGGDGPGNYTTIQGAINDANNGDTVFVYDDSSPYYENVVVDKSINLVGEDRNTTIIDGNWNEAYVLMIITDYVNVSGFIIKNSGDGIEMWSNYSNIDGNFITNNIWNGIYLYMSHDTHIIKNNINNCGDGISLLGSNDNIIIENEIKDHNSDGICLEYSKFNNISENIISDNSYNIFFHFYSAGNIIRKNIVSNCRQTGILIMYGSDKNIICSNTFTNNGWYGLQLETSGNIVCHNNFINNKVHHATFIRITIVTTLINFNKWDSNYWDDWIGLENPSLSRLPKVIVGLLTRGKIKIPSFDFDWHPAKEPYDISAEDMPEVKHHEEQSIQQSSIWSKNSQEIFGDQRSRQTQDRDIIYGGIKVTIKDALLKTPLEKACVVAWDLNEEVLYYLLPDENEIGAYLSNSLPVGEYFIGSGKEEYNIDGAIIIIKENRQSTLTFHLKPLSSDDSSKASQLAENLVVAINLLSSKQLNRLFQMMTKTLNR